MKLLEKKNHKCNIRISVYDTGSKECGLWVRWGRRRRNPAKAKRKPREKPQKPTRRKLAGKPRSFLPKTTSTPFWYSLYFHSHNFSILKQTCIYLRLFNPRSWAFKKRKPRRRTFTSTTTFPRLLLAPTAR